jgi:hypothetical protein
MKAKLVKESLNEPIVLSIKWTSCKEFVVFEICVVHCENKRLLINMVSNNSTTFSTKSIKRKE